MPIAGRRIVAAIPVLFPLAVALTLSCAFGRTEPAVVQMRDTTVAVTTPVKAHLSS
jgi:hypothetical protein